MSPFTLLRLDEQRDRTFIASGHLVDVLNRVRGIEFDDCEFEPTIFAEAPWTAASAAIVVAEDPVSCCAPSAPGFQYLLEVALAQDALTRWAMAHDGARPEPDEAVAAVIDYALGCSPLEPSSWSSRTLRSGSSSASP